MTLALRMRALKYTMLATVFSMVPCFAQAQGVDSIDYNRNLEQEEKESLGNTPPPVVQAPKADEAPAPVNDDGMIEPGVMAEPAPMENTAPIAADVEDEIATPAPSPESTPAPEPVKETPVAAEKPSATATTSADALLAYPANTGGGLKTEAKSEVKQIIDEPVAAPAQMPTPAPVEAPAPAPEAKTAPVAEPAATSEPTTSSDSLLRHPAVNAAEIATPAPTAAPVAEQSTPPATPEAKMEAPPVSRDVTQEILSRSSAIQDISTPAAEESPPAKKTDDIAELIDSSAPIPVAAPVHSSTVSSDALLAYPTKTQASQVIDDISATEEAPTEPVAPTAPTGPTVEDILALPATKPQIVEPPPLPTTEYVPEPHLVQNPPPVPVKAVETIAQPVAAQPTPEISPELAAEIATDPYKQWRDYTNELPQAQKPPAPQQDVTTSAEKARGINRLNSIIENNPHKKWIVP